MTIYAIASERPDALKAAIERVYPTSHFFLNTTKLWFVTDNASPRDVALKLNVADGVVAGQVMVMATEDYFGWANKELWPWLHAAAANE